MDRIYLWEPIYLVLRVLNEVVRLDERGRVTIPREVRDRLGLRPGERLSVRVMGNSIVLAKAEDPFKVIKKVLKSITFHRGLRREAEAQALQELGRRYQEQAGS